MTMSWCKLVLGVTAVAVAFGYQPQPAHAIKEFKTAFDAMYVKDGTPLAKAVAEAKCNVCHKGDSKKMRNEYGQALAGLLKKADKENTAKINEALKKVEDAKAADGKTFGDHLKAGELPSK